MSIFSEAVRSAFNLLCSSSFLRVHFTTREVPAVALGVIERRLSVGEIFHMQMA